MTLIERLYKSHDAETLCADAARAIEALQAENERLKAERERNLDSIRVNNEIISKKNAERDALAANLANLETDAERYRWLREQNGDGIVEVSISDTDSMAAWIYGTDDLDAAIDTAKGGQHEDA